ncbi:MAG: hypothetical protein V1858_00405 [Candidatus Gottesmanbacteria bacterium]
MTKISRIIVFCLLLISFYLLNPSSVSAQIFWSTPDKISKDTNNDVLQTATVTGPNGYLHTVWTELTPPAHPRNLQGPPNPGIFYSYWNGDAWSTAVLLPKDPGFFAGYPALTVTGTQQNSRVHIVWEEKLFWEDPDNEPTQAWSRILYSYSDDYGVNWSSPISISSPLDSNPGAWSWNPWMMKDNANNIHVGFGYGDDTMRGDWVIYYTKLNGTWSPPQRIIFRPGQRELIGEYAMAIDSLNNPHIVVSSWGDNPNPTLFYSTLSGGSWTAPTTLDTNGDYPQLIIDNTNKLHVIFSTPWYDSTNMVMKNHLMYMNKVNGGSWSSKLEISNQAKTGWGDQPIMGLTFDSNNNVYIGWGEIIGWSDHNDPYWWQKGIQVSYKKSTNGGISWDNPTYMRYVYDLINPFIYRDKWDNQHFAWVEQDALTKKWDLYYSTVPVNAQLYYGSDFSMNMSITGDTLSIPAAANPTIDGLPVTSATISAQVGPLPASFNPTYTTIPRSFTFRPHRITFASRKEATAVIRYSDPEIIGSDERNMKLYIWDATLNGGVGGWSTDFATSVNTSQNRATVILPHFSLYGLAVPLMQTNFQSPVSNLSGSTIPLSYQIINLATNQPADPPVQRTILDENGLEVPFWDEYKAELVDSSNNVVQTLYFDQGNGNLHYDTLTNYYNSSFSVCGLITGDYTINVYLASNKVGSLNIHFTPISPTTVTFLPPLTEDETYIMNDGSTLPFKYTLSQCDSILTSMQNVQVEIINTNDNLLVTVLTPSFDPLTGQYQAIIHTKELNMGLYTYEGKVSSDNLNLQDNSIYFSLVDQGKAKGLGHR